MLFGRRSERSVMIQTGDVHVLYRFTRNSIYQPLADMKFVLWEVRVKYTNTVLYHRKIVRVTF